MKHFKRPEPIYGCVSPNTVLDTELDFYLSYNDKDVDCYGDVTTAIVTKQDYKFYILKGDHREALAELSKNGLDACLAYYKSHESLQHRFSDKLD